MEIKKIFKTKDQEHAPKFFLGIEINDSLVKTCLWQVHLDKISVVNLGSFEAWDNEDSLINGIDASLTQATKEIEQEPNEVIFGLPESWMEDNQIKPDKSGLIKKIIKSLDLKPIGLVSITSAIIHQLKQEEGIPPSAILLEILPTKVFVNLLDQGRIVQKEEVGRSDDLAKDVQEGLVRINFPKLPSRFLLTNGSDLENEAQQIVSYPWQEHLPFLHIPKVKTFPPDYSIKAIALAGGFEAALAAGQIAIPSLDEGPKSVQDLGFHLEPEEEVSAPAPTQEPETPDPDPDPEPQPTYDNFEPVVNDPLAQSFADPEQLKPIPTPRFKIKAPNFSLPRFSSSSKILFLGLVPVALLLIFLPLYYFFLARSQVIIKIKPEQLSKRIEVSLATKTNGSDLTFPVQFKEESQQGQDSIPTTGETQVGDKAQGKITIYNATFEEKIIDEGESLETENGILFTLNETVKIASKSGAIEAPPGKVENISVTATKIGTAGNINKDSRLSVANFPRTSVEAVAITDFSGGSSRTVKAVAQKDIDTLLDNLTQKLLDQVKDSIQETDPDTTAIIIEEPQISSTKFSADVGQEASSLSLDLKATAKLLTYSHRVFVNTTNKAISTEYSGKKLLAENTQIKLDQIEPTAESDQVYSATIFVEGSLVPDVDTSSLATKIKGKTVTSAKKILQTVNNFSGLTLKTWPNIPGLTYFLPFKANRIEIVLQIAN